MRKFILAFALLVVAALIGVILYVRVFTRADPQFTTTLESVVPARLDGWTVEDVPLADAPILIEAPPVPLASAVSVAETGGNAAGAAAADGAAELGLFGALGAFLRRRKKD